MSFWNKLGELMKAREPNEMSVVVAQPRQEILAPMDFDISLEREDRPEFKRTYKATIPGGFRIEFTFYFNIFGERSIRGYATLTQNNGNNIYFDPHRVADKIIDRDLAPKVQSLSEKVIYLDRQFAQNPPTEYVDKAGARWVRADRIRAIAA